MALNVGSFSSADLDKAIDAARGPQAAATSLPGLSSTPEAWGGHLLDHTDVQRWWLQK